ncbi:MAG: LysM peptidoglycan-binding domain-containing protein [Lachnospiraceae bacterium]|nr:LysM peptidoglycan-binding domain-containing protein [Lachnospiraceae bacterium]
MNKSTYKKKSRNKWMYAVVMTACLCMLGFAMVKAGAVTTSAQSNSNAAKYYKSVQVQQDDNLWTIAEANMTSGYSDKRDYIAEIKSINHINGDTIHSGEYICVPYYK